jgi:hypothetical protein
LEISSGLVFKQAEANEKVQDGDCGSFNNSHRFHLNERNFVSSGAGGSETKFRQRSPVKDDASQNCIYIIYVYVYKKNNKYEILPIRNLTGLRKNIFYAENRSHQQNIPIPIPTLIK